MERQIIDCYYYDDAPVDLGTEVYTRFGKQFPLLFKYLDAREDLSIQVHPNDELAKDIILW
jgi:mannose-6-phosphate isomerase